jgi:UDP-2-acetamido-3-amino-2,3-dideoxy-glucuronate N-acetyltransferase
MTDPAQPGSQRLPGVFVHPSAIVDEGASVGQGTKIWHFCHVMSGAKIGTDVVLGQNCFVADGAVIGDGCRIQNNVSVFAGVVLEDRVFCGPSMVFTNVLTPRAGVDRHSEFTPTLVRHDATLGANCTIICGTIVGEYATVAAGAVVTHDVLPHQLVAGIPARVAGWVCRCGEVLRFSLDAGVGEQATCRRCGHSYEMAEKGLRAGTVRP